jgi:hypothetical protein
MHETFDPARADGPCYASRVGILRTWETTAAIEHDDAVVSGQGDCILNRRIAGSDYDNGLTTERIRRFERVLHAGQVAARHVDPAWMSLHAERENDIPAAKRFAGLDVDFKTATRASDCRYFGAVFYIDVGIADALLPGLEDRLPASGRKLHVTAQGQHAGLGHDVLVVLILLNRIGMRAARLEQHVRHSLLAGMSRRAQAAGSCPHNDQIKSRLLHPKAFPV